MRARYRIFLIIALLSTFIIFPNPAMAADIVITKPATNKIIPESRDFPIKRFADPWDMSNYLDLSNGVNYHDIANARFKDGVFSARTTGGDASVFPLFPGTHGVLPTGRDGVINKINASMYNRLSIRLYSSHAAVAQFLWFYDQVWSDVGAIAFAVQSGWHTYIINPTTSGRWSGKPLGLRFDPNSQSGIDFKINWIRMYQQATRRVQLAWTDDDPGDQVDIYLDRNNSTPNDNMGLITRLASNAANLYLWDPAAYPAGNYYLYIKKPSQTAVYSRKIVINRSPLIKINSPSEKGGADYATVVAGDPWNMDSPSDISSSTNIKDMVFSGGIMTGISQHGDSFFHLRVPTGIDTNRFHLLTFRYRYNGAYDYGLGTMCRVVWSPDPNNINLFQVSNDIVSYPKWTEYTIDLKKASLDVGTIGWNGTMNVFRFDPLEVPGNRRFFVDYIRLSETNRAYSRFSIKWVDGKQNQRPTRVNIYYDTNNSGFNGSLIISKMQVAGDNRYVWNTSSIPAGSYWIYLVADDGVSETKQYSSGPVDVAH